MPLDQQGQGGIIEDIHMVEQAKFLENDADTTAQVGGLGTVVRPRPRAEQRHFAQRRLLRQVDHPHQGCLAGARRANQEMERAGRQGKVQVFQYVVVVIVGRRIAAHTVRFIAQADVVEFHDGLGRGLRHTAGVAFGHASISGREDCEKVKDA